MGVITIADLRRLTGKPAHVINYAIDRFGPPPAGRVGISRVWTSAALPALLESIQRTKARPRKQGCAS
jgi:hypothetical protein